MWWRREWKREWLLVASSNIRNRALNATGQQQAQNQPKGVTSHKGVFWPGMLGMLKIGLASESNQVSSLKKKERHSTETLDLGQEDPVSHLTGDCERVPWGKCYFMLPYISAHGFRRRQDAGLEGSIILSWFVHCPEKLNSLTTSAAEFLNIQVA